MTYAEYVCTECGEDASLGQIETDPILCDLCIEDANEYDSYAHGQLDSRELT